MTELLPIEPTFAQVRRAAIDDVNRWRGHCLEQLARLDRSVNDCLARATGTLPQAFPKRLKLLHDLTSPGGSQPDKALHRTIGELMLLRAKWRDVLAHATSRVLVDRPGCWVWLYTMPRANNAADEVGHVVAVDAHALGKELQDKVNVLKSLLNQPGRT
jgi:hypothetical protein